MIDINEIESMKQWTNDYKVRMFWDLVAEVKRLREQPKVTIDEWDKVLNSEHEGPYVTMYLEDGREYIGALRLYKDENGKVVE